MTVRLTTGPWTMVTAGEGLEEQTDDQACSWTGDLWSSEVGDGDSTLVILTSSLSWSLIEYSDAVLFMASSLEGDTREAGGSYRDGGHTYTSYTIHWSIPYGLKSLGY